MFHLSYLLRITAACVAFEAVLGWSKWILLVDQETREQGRFLVANCLGLCMVVTAMVGSQSSCPCPISLPWATRTKVRTKDPAQNLGLC